jgi:hypothetical protein
LFSVRIRARVPVLLRNLLLFLFLCGATGRVSARFRVYFPVYFLFGTSWHRVPQQKRVYNSLGQKSSSPTT